jgi:hypothetical protein
VEDEWLYSQRFSYIHGRSLATCFKSTAAVIQKAYNHLVPGGYLELQDAAMPIRAIDDSMEGTALQHWSDLVMKGITRIGKDWTRVGKYKEYLEEAGFEDVVEVHHAWPSNPWPKGEHNKVLGAWTNEDFLSGVHGISMGVLTKVMGMSVESVEVLLVDVRKDISDRRIHAYLPIHIVYGRKPE